MSSSTEIFKFGWRKTVLTNQPFKEAEMPLWSPNGPAEITSQWHNHFLTCAYSQARFDSRKTSFLLSPKKAGSVVGYCGSDCVLRNSKSMFFCIAHLRPEMKKFGYELHARSGLRCAIRLQEAA
jgi:hypothetical protein